MELLCEKYKKKMSSETARCQHPTEYCKFRTACLIHFIGKEADREQGCQHENGTGPGQDVGK